MSRRSEYWKGIAITFAGVIVLSTDALFIRVSGATGPQTAFWRALFTFFSLAILFGISKRGVWKETLVAGGTGILFSGFLWGSSGLTFSIGVQHSGAAVMLVMLGLSPFFAAAHSYLFYRTKSHPLTLIAAVVAVTGIGYMYSSQLDSIGLKDLFYTIWTPMLVGTNFSFLRQNPHVDRISISMVGGIIGSLIALIFAKGAIAVTASQLWPLIVLGVLVIPFSQLALGMGTKYIPAGESALISSLETIIGIFYVWIFLHEVPSTQTLIGAAIVFASIITNTLVQAYRAQE